MGGLAFFVLPFESIPDMLRVIGSPHDAAVLPPAIRLVGVHLTPQPRDAARRVLARAAAPPAAVSRACGGRVEWGRDLAREDRRAGSRHGFDCKILPYAGDIHRVQVRTPWQVDE